MNSKEILYQEWLDWTTLINGNIIVWYFDFDECIEKVFIYV